VGRGRGRDGRGKGHRRKKSEDLFPNRFRFSSLCRNSLWDFRSSLIISIFSNRTNLFYSSIRLKNDLEMSFLIAREIPIDIPSLILCMLSLDLSEKSRVCSILRSSCDRFNQSQPDTWSIVRARVSYWLPCILLWFTEHFRCVAHCYICTPLLLLLLLLLLLFFFFKEHT